MRCPVAIGSKGSDSGCGVAKELVRDTRMSTVKYSGSGMRKESTSKAPQASLSEIPNPNEALLAGERAGGEGVRHDGVSAGKVRGTLVSVSNAFSFSPPGTSSQPYSAAGWHLILRRRGSICLGSRTTGF